jgi:hypothetical protein
MLMATTGKRNAAAKTNIMHIKQVVFICLTLGLVHSKRLASTSNVEFNASSTRLNASHRLVY